MAGRIPVHRRIGDALQMRLISGAATVRSVGLTAVCHAAGPRNVSQAVPGSAWLTASTARRMSWVAASGCDTKET
jgi:hypothetical protein